MTLALRLGKTLSELQHTLSLSELLLWQAFDAINPIGDARGDIQTAQLVSAIYGAQGATVSLDDALLHWGEKNALSDNTPPDNGLETFLAGLM